MLLILVFAFFSGFGLDQYFELIAALEGIIPELVQTTWRRFNYWYFGSSDTARLNDNPPRCLIKFHSYITLNLDIDGFSSILQRHWIGKYFFSSINGPVLLFITNKFLTYRVIFDSTFSDFLLKCQMTLKIITVLYWNKDSNKYVCMHFYKE